MARPTTATVRPVTSAGQLDSSLRPTTSSKSRNDQAAAENDNEGPYSSSEATCNEGSDEDDQHEHHYTEDDDVFAFAPPGLSTQAVEVVQAPSSLPVPPPAAVVATQSKATTNRESVLYYDQKHGTFYDARGNLVDMQKLLHSEPEKHVKQETPPPSRGTNTSIKWHPSTRQDKSSDKNRNLLASATSTYATSCNGHGASTTPTSDSAELLRTLPRPCYSRAVELELEQDDDDSPYAEVRASVSNVDDPSMPAITFRSILLGVGLSAVCSTVNTFLSQRNPPLQIVAIIVQILAHSAGGILASILPIRSFRLHLPKLRKARYGKQARRSYAWSLNPGPWNIKEHTVVLIAATTGLNPSYSLSLLLAQDLPRFWDDRRSFLYGLLSICAPQFVGLALAGFLRDVLVEPASMIWPQNLAVSTVLNTLHADEDSLPGRDKRQMSRLTFFTLASACAFVVFFFPGYLFTALSAFNWVCWIWPDNVPVNVVFGSTTGLGASVLTFDWTVITYLGSPLVTPWWAQANVMTGFIIGVWIAVPILYFRNVLNTAYLPVLSAGSFDRFGQRYNVSIVSPDHRSLRDDAYAGYSQVYISAGLVVTYFGGFCVLSAAVVHTALYHGRFVWERLRPSRGLPDDCHARLMRRYASVPFFWYVVVLVTGVVMSICLASAYGTGLPVWALGLAFLVPCVYFLPFGFIFAMSGYPPGVNLVSELLASRVLPGKPLPVMMFKTISQQTLSFGLLFAQDQKLALYMKIAPRSIFCVQVLSIVVNSVVQILTKDYMRDQIVGLCDPSQPQRFTCPSVNLFYTASVIWGAIGVERSFGPRSPYRSLFYGLLIGAILPVITWYTSRRLGWSYMRYVSAPIIFGGMSLAPPASGINFTSAIVVGWLFQYWMRRHRVQWWLRYNFVLSAALDLGTLLSSIVIYFLLQLPKDGALELQWWGNEVSFNTADAMGVPLLQPPEEGFAPPPGAG